MFKLHELLKSIILNNYDTKFTSKPKIKISDYEFGSNTYIKWIKLDNLFLMKEYFLYPSYVTKKMMDGEKSMQIEIPSITKTKNATEVVIFENDFVEVDNDVFISEMIKDIWNELEKHDVG